MNWTPRWLTLFSAILIVASFPPWNLWPLIWICLIPWFYSLEHNAGQDFRRRVWQGFWLNYFVNLMGFHWVAYALHEYGEIPWIISIIGFQIFCLFGQPQFILFSVCYRKCQKEFPFGFCSWIWIGLLYAAIDWISPKLFQDTLGHALYGAPLLRQSADLGGVQLLTFFIFISNFTIWNLWKRWNQSKTRQEYLAIALTFLLLFSNAIYGWYRKSQVQNEIQRSPQKIQAAGIQANIGDFMKLAAEQGIREAAEEVIHTFTQLSDQALQMKKKPDLIIWPETAYPSTFRNPHSRTESEMETEVELYPRERNIPLLFGGYDTLHSKDFNSFFFLSSQGILQTYHKHILLLFGEYIPGAETFQILKDILPQVGNFGRGPGASVYSVPLVNPQVSSVKITPLICYEALFPEYVIESARKGSQLILNITNDSWFGNWGEPQLHLALSAFRSIETRLPMLRVTNTGISALILPDGEITNPTGIGVQQILNVEIPLGYSIPTLIKRWGNWFSWLSCVLGLMGLIALGRKNQTNGRSSKSN